MSSTTAKIANLNHLKIISLGPDVVPYILERMKIKPDHWFIALRVLTGCNPVKENSSFMEATEAWLNWGRSEDLID